MRVHSKDCTEMALDIDWDVIFGDLGLDIEEFDSRSQPVHEANPPIQTSTYSAPATCTAPPNPTIQTRTYSAPATCTAPPNRSIQTPTYSAPATCTVPSNPTIQTRTYSAPATCTAPPNPTIQTRTYSAPATCTAPLNPTIQTRTYSAPATCTAPPKTGSQPKRQSILKTLLNDAKNNKRELENKENEHQQKKRIIKKVEDDYVQPLIPSNTIWTPYERRMLTPERFQTLQQKALSLQREINCIVKIIEDIVSYVN